MQTNPADFKGAFCQACVVRSRAICADLDSDEIRLLNSIGRRRSLAADRGMLFDFHQPMDGVAFWMRNTLIPLDIIYIGPNGTVVSIARNVQPLNERPVPAGGKTRWVLELRAGRAGEIGLLPGDRVLHRTMPRG